MLFTFNANPQAASLRNSNKLGMKAVGGDSSSLALKLLPLPSLSLPFPRATLLTLLVQP